MQRLHQRRINRRRLVIVSAIIAEIDADRCHFNDLPRLPVVIAAAALVSLDRVRPFIAICCP